MNHTVRDKQKLINRIRRIRGQIDGIERALHEECECIGVLQQITSCRGAMTGLMTVVLEDHIRTHLIDLEPPGAHGPSDAKEQLIEIVRSYFK